jgi:hypothetical protein
MGLSFYLGILTLSTYLVNGGLVVVLRQSLDRVLSDRHQ